MSRTVSLPEKMETPRYVAARVAELPDGFTQTPLVGGPKDPKASQVQERKIAHARVFDLTVPGDVKDYEAVWQLISDGNAELSLEVLPAMNPDGKFVTFLRWASSEYVVPQA
jgi:hypothetical protein